MESTPPGWANVGLLELATIRSGQVDPRKPKYRDMPLIAPDHIATGTGRLLAVRSARDQGAISGKYLVEPGDVIYSKIRPYLMKVHLAQFPALCSADMYALKPRAGVDERYLANVLLGRRFTNFAVGESMRSGIPKINREALAGYELSAPAEPEQRAIGDALGVGDMFITSLERLIAKKRDVKHGVMQELLTGRTRLPGFTGDWKSRTFDEVMVVVNTRRSQVDVDGYREAGAYPIVDQGRRYIAGYVGSEYIPIHAEPEGFCVFGDHTTNTKFVNFDFVVGADGTKVLRSRCTRDYVTRYICYLLELQPVDPTGYNRHFRKLRERLFLLPQGQEQLAIVNLLQCIDVEIEALERRLESARAVKVGMMQELLTGRTRLLVEEEA